MKFEVEVIEGELVLLSNGQDEFMELCKLRDKLDNSNIDDLNRCLTISGEDLSSGIDDLEDDNSALDTALDEMTSERDDLISEIDDLEDKIGKLEEIIEKIP